MYGHEGTVSIGWVHTRAQNGDIGATLAGMSLLEEYEECLIHIVLRLIKIQYNAPTSKVTSTLKI